MVNFAMAEGTAKVLLQEKNAWDKRKSWCFLWLASVSQPTSPVWLGADKCEVSANSVRQDRATSIAAVIVGERRFIETVYSVLV